MGTTYTLVRLSASINVATEITSLDFSQLSSTLLDVAYGIDVLPENDPYIHKAEEAITTLKFAAVPGKFLVDSFPFRTRLLFVLVSVE